jgi:hypothetical protein
MKQRINWEQFITLSFEQVRKLQVLLDITYHRVESKEHWEKIKNYTYVYDDGVKSNIHTSYTGFLTKCTIGKMIEILESTGQTVHINRNLKEFSYPERGFLWWVQTQAVYWDHQSSDVYKAEELCDCLWEAVKRVL